MVVWFRCARGPSNQQAAQQRIGTDEVHADGRGPSPLNSVFYGQSLGIPMTATSTPRRRWPRGVAGLVINLLGWAIVFVSAPTVDSYSFLDTPPSEPEVEGSADRPTAMRFDLSRYCFDCPAFSAFGKALGSTWDPLPVMLFLATNWPALRAAKGREGPWGLAALNPAVLLVVSSVQWFCLSAAWRMWRDSRRKRQSLVAVA